ncbi:MAG TPA: ABC transporter permease [Chitinophagaceae bacterium]|nr:ABC transporter permease [Chitinophagaceae bacterium]
MLKNYFKTSFRNLTRNKGYALINIAGLAIGIAVCMMIFIVIQYQTSYDDFHPKKDRIYRILTQIHHADNGTVTSASNVAYLLPAALKANFPQVAEAAPVYASHNDELLVMDDNGQLVKKFKEDQGLFFTQPSFFNIFNFPLLAGSYASLKETNTVLLTKEIAEKYFGDWKLAMGKTISLKSGGFMFDHGTDVLKVTGILATIPDNTDFHLKLVVSLSTSYIATIMKESTNWKETTAGFGCYILMSPNTSADDFNRQLIAFSKKIQTPEYTDTQIIQPLNDVHYDVETGNYSNKTISRQLLNVLWLIAAFILAIACVNFINLSTAQAVNRSKEIGVRKVLGSNRSQLRIKFLIETFIIVIVAVILAAGISLVALPYVNNLLELSISYSILYSSVILIFLAAVTVAVTLLAGFYPSIVLSRFNPITALKGKQAAKATSGISLRRGLVIFQFIIAQALIIGTLIIVQQMTYFMNQPLGFDKDAIIIVPYRVDSTRMARMDFVRHMLTEKGVEAVSFSSNTPIEAGNDNWTTLKYNHAIKESDLNAITKFADEEFVPTYKLQLVAGRNLKKSPFTQEFLVNEALVKSLGLKNPEEILNKQISIWNDLIKCPVVGVLKDFNDRPSQYGVAPLIMGTNITMYNQVSIKISTADMPATLQSVKNFFEQTFPDFVYDYRFLDDKIGGFYKQESQLAQLYKIFAAIAIFLSCLGLYGLASFMAVQRIKEVGIRKVLGASVVNIVYLFSKEFVILIAVAFAIATPIAWYYMHQWLQAYVYRINIGWWVFGVGGLAALIIALATISFQAIKAARANPVKSLRTE